MEGRSESGCHDHVFRNQSVGIRLNSAGRAPRFATVMRMQMSSTSAFAYSTNTSKYLLFANIPVSTSSYSGSLLARPRFMRMRSSYGYASCGYLYTYFMYECVGVLST